MAPQAVLDRMQSMAPMRPTETMAQQALGGSAGGTYLAPALYRPVVQASPHSCFTRPLMLDDMHVQSQLSRIMCLACFMKCFMKCWGISKSMPQH